MARNRSNFFLFRHSNFGGTFHVENIKALNDENNLLYHKPLQRKYI